MGNNPLPLLSVCLITYNHANFIKEALEGVLMQEADFSWELIIADDHSTDGTTEIVIDYKKKYPNIIKLILQEKNVGPSQNWLDMINLPKSRYIAFLEGDDYWIDPLKLQKQVDIFMKHPDTIVCGARAKTWNESRKEFTYITPALDKDISCMTPEQFFHLGTWVKTCTRIVPRDLIMGIPLEYGTDHRQIHYLLAKNPTGTFRCLDEVVAIYREHAGGAFSGANPIDTQKKYFESTRLIAKLYDDDRSVIMHNNARQTARELLCTSSLNARERIYYAHQFFVLILSNLSYSGIKWIFNQTLHRFSTYLDRYPTLKAFIRSIYRFLKRTNKQDKND